MPLDDQNSPMDFSQKLKAAINRWRADAMSSQGVYDTDAARPDSFGDTDQIVRLLDRRDKTQMSSRAPALAPQQGNIGPSTGFETFNPMADETSRKKLADADWSDPRLQYPSSQLAPRRSDAGGSPPSTSTDLSPIKGGTPPAVPGVPSDPYADLRKQIAALQPPEMPTFTPMPSGPSAGTQRASLGFMLGQILSGNARNIPAFLQGQENVQAHDIERWRLQHGLEMEQYNIARQKFADRLDQLVREGQISAEDAAYQKRMKDEGYQRYGAEVASLYRQLHDPNLSPQQRQQIEQQIATIRKTAESQGLNWGVLRIQAEGEALKLLGMERVQVRLQDGSIVEMSPAQAAQYERQQGSGYDFGGKHFKNEAEVERAWEGGLITTRDIQAKIGSDWQPPQEWVDKRAHKGTVRSGATTGHPASETLYSNSLKNLTIDFKGGHFPAPSDIQQYVSAARSRGMNDAAIAAAVVQAATANKRFRAATLNGRRVIVDTQDNSVYDALTGQRLN